MQNNFEKTLTEETFEYGNHTIKVTITIENSWFRYPLNKSIYDKNQIGLHRVVTVEAQSEEKTDIKNSNSVFLEAEPKPHLSHRMKALFTEKTPTEHLFSEYGPRIPNLKSQVQKAVKPVFTELDKIYKYTNLNYDLDITTSMEKVKNTVSWVEIEDEISEITEPLNTKIASN